MRGMLLLFSRWLLLLALGLESANAATTIHYWDMDTVSAGVPVDVVGGLATSVDDFAGANPVIIDSTTYGTAYAGGGNVLVSTLGPSGHLLADVYDEGGSSPTAMAFGMNDFSFSYWSYDDFAGDGDGRGPRVFDNLLSTNEGIQLGTNLAGLFNYRMDDTAAANVISNAAGNLDTLTQPRDAWTHVAVNVARSTNTAEVFFNGASQGTYDISALTADIVPSMDLEIGVINGGANAGAAQAAGLDDLAFYEGLLSSQDLTGLAGATITPLDLVPEPSATLLLSVGLLGLGVLRRK